MLIEFGNICEKYGWQYFLAFGTLIGAVRHHGFIPWDDDIDVVMPRSDYNQFVKYMKTNYAGKLTLHDWQNTKNYWYSLARVSNDEFKYINKAPHEKQFTLGCFIDIYPLDNWCNTEKKRVELLKKCTAVRTMYCCYVNPRATPSKWKIPGRYMKKLIFSVKSIGYENKGEYADQKIQNLISQYTTDEDLWVGGPAWTSSNLPCKKEWFADKVYLKFEGVNMPAPIDYDAFLRAGFGNYMILPPENERHPHHDYEIIDLEQVL